MNIRHSCKAVLAGAVATLALGMSAASAQTVLRMNNWLPPQHSQLIGTMMPWAEKVAEATDGRVTVELTDASLGAPPRQYDLAVDGIADVTFGVLGYTPGRFKLAAVAELPFVAEKGEALSVALWKTHEAMFEEADEYSDVVLLGLYAHGSGRILTTDGAGAVTSLEDYEGKKFRVGGGIIQEINPLLGGVNVAAPANEVYEILSQGVADGTLLPLEAYPSFNLSGIIKHATSIPGGFYSSVWFAVMNRDAFESLSPEDQEAIMSVSGIGLARLGGRSFDEADTAARKIMEEDGVEFHVADDAFVQGLREALQPVEANWIEQAESLGVDGEAALEMMRTEAAAFEGEGGSGEEAEGGDAAAAEDSAEAETGASD